MGGVAFEVSTLRCSKTGMKKGIIRIGFWGFRILKYTIPPNTSLIVKAPRNHPKHPQSRDLEPQPGFLSPATLGIVWP